MTRLHLRDHPRKVSHGLHPEYVAHNNDPRGGAWTGYQDILDQLDDGLGMAAGVGILPVDKWQHDEYRRFQNDVIARNGERRPPAQHGTGGIHIHIERAA